MLCTPFLALPKLIDLTSAIMAMLLICRVAWHIHNNTLFGLKWKLRTREHKEKKEKAILGELATLNELGGRGQIVGDPLRAAVPDEYIFRLHVRRVLTNDHRVPSYATLPPCSRERTLLYPYRH